MVSLFWPETLPKTLIMDGLSAKRSSSVIRTRMDAGPGKARRRYTASSKIYTGRMLLTVEQRDTLDQFFRLKLADGALRFFFTDPQTLETGEFRFTENYTENSADGLFEIQMSLERL
jgi:hypothetical protein